jgi:hypothetical protein
MPTDAFFADYWGIPLLRANDARSTFCDYDKRPIWMGAFLSRWH